MPYIEELRKLIGHRPLILVGAAMLISDARGYLLLGLRSDNHCWGIPGGSIELSETLEQTVRRETFEETGLAVGRLSLFGVYSGPEMFYTYPNGDQVYNVSVVSQSSDFSGTIQTDQEHSAWDFFPVNRLPEPISPPIRPVLRDWINQQQR